MFNFNKEITKEASKKQKVIVLPEASFSSRVRQAIKVILKKKIAKIIVVGKANEFTSLKENKNLVVYDPENYENFETLAKIFYEKRKEKGLTQTDAQNILKTDKIYFATLLVECGFADGMVCGAEVTTAETLRPALQVIKGKNGQKVSSCVLLINKNKIFAFADCAVNINPTADELSLIAKQTVDTFKCFVKGQIPQVAFLSFSTNGSSSSESVQKMFNAKTEFCKNNHLINADGEMQADTALCENVAKTKMPLSSVAGKANILVFPDLNAGNIGYKLFKIASNAIAIGPIVQGLNKPINDVSRACSAKEIALMVAITAIQASKK